MKKLFSALVTLGLLLSIVASPAVHAVPTECDHPLPCTPPPPPPQNCDGLGNCRI